MTHAQMGLVNLLVAKGVFTAEEYTAAVNEAAKEENSIHNAMLDSLRARYDTTTT